MAEHVAGGGGGGAGREKADITKLLLDPLTVSSSRKELGSLGTQDSLGVHNYLHLATNS